MSTDILLAIRSGEADTVLDLIADAVKQRRDVLGRQLLRSVRPGVRVETIAPLRANMVGLKGTINQVNQTRVSVVLDKGQFVGGRFQSSIDLGMPVTIPATCVRVLEDQTAPAVPTNGAVVTEIPFNFGRRTGRGRREY
jgi:hypothetical protein